MKAVILAAGYATRLYPLTKETPKPLLTIGKKKMMEHIVDSIEKLDCVDDIFVVTNSKFYQHFLDWKNSFESKKSITIINNGTTCNEDRLGAIGDMHHVISKAEIDDDVLIIAGDNLFEVDLNDLFTFFKEKNNSVIGSKDLKDKSILANKFGVVEVDDDNKIIGFEEKPSEPKSSLAATMIYMIKKDHLEELYNIMENGAPDNAGEFIKFISEKGKVHAYSFEDAWYDIGSHDELARVHNIYMNK